MTEAAIDKVKENCCGCFACYNCCPAKAISIELNNEGFYTPIVDEKLCNNCKICHRHCPIITCSNNNEYIAVKAYAGWSKCRETLRLSSSGGIFTELAKHIILQQGIVFGVKWGKT